MTERTLPDAGSLRAVGLTLAALTAATMMIAAVMVYQAALGILGAA